MRCWGSKLQFLRSMKLKHPAADDACSEAACETACEAVSEADSEAVNKATGDPVSESANKGYQ